jgi:hypothetical protein
MRCNGQNILESLSSVLCSLNACSLLPWGGGPDFTLHYLEKSAFWFGHGLGSTLWRDKGHQKQGQSYLGNGPGAAAPSVQHDSVFVSFLQHFILKQQNILSREKLHRSLNSPHPLCPWCGL